MVEIKKSIVSELLSNRYAIIDQWTNSDPNFFRHIRISFVGAVHEAAPQYFVQLQLPVEYYSLSLHTVSLIKHIFKLYFIISFIHTHRLTPVYMFLILFNATWLVRLQNGPLWPHITDTERTFCRANWWTNLFYINNIVAVSEPVIEFIDNILKNMLTIKLSIVLPKRMVFGGRFPDVRVGSCVAHNFLEVCENYIN